MSLQKIKLFDTLGFLCALLQLGQGQLTVFWLHKCSVQNVHHTFHWNFPMRNVGAPNSERLANAGNVWYVEIQYDQEHFWHDEENLKSFRANSERKSLQNVLKLIYPVAYTSDKWKNSVQKESQYTIPLLISQLPPAKEGKIKRDVKRKSTENLISEKCKVLLFPSSFFFSVYGWSIAFNDGLGSEREADISTWARGRQRWSKL